MSKQKEDTMFNHKGDSDIPVRVALYARVSSEEQKQGQNIQSQIDQGDRYSEMFSLRLVDSFIDEAVSGTVPLNERPEGFRLLEAARDKQFDVVIVYRLDRLARKLKVLLDGWEELDSLGVGVRSMTEPLDTSNPLGRFVMQLLGSIAELERETIIERTRDGKEASVRRGFWPGGRPPMGYSIEREDDRQRGRSHLVVNEVEAETIRLVFHTYLEDKLNVFKVASYLNSKGVPTSTTLRTGKPTRWSGSRIQDILRDSLYKGEFKFYDKKNVNDRDVVTTNVPALVSDEVWNDAQNRLEYNTRNSPRNMKRFYLLRGHVTCGLCGHNCVGQGRSNKNISYYVCNWYLRNETGPNCKAIRVRAETLEELVWNDITEFSHTPGKVIKLLEEKIRREQKDTDGVKNEVSELDGHTKLIMQRRQWVIENASRGLISDAEAEEALKATQQELDVIEARRKALKGQIELTQLQASQVDQTEALLATIAEKADNADDQTKRTVIEALVQSVVVTPNKDTGVDVDITYRFGQSAEHIASSTYRH